MDSLLEGFMFLNVGNIFFFFFVGWIGYNKEKEKLKYAYRGETLREKVKRLARREIKDSVSCCAFFGKWINSALLFGSLFTPSFPSFSPTSLILLISAFVCHVVNKKTFVPQPFL